MRVYGVIAVICLIIIIDLWCCVSPNIPENNPYYLRQTPEEIEDEEKVKKERERFQEEKKKREADAYSQRQKDKKATKDNASKDSPFKKIAGALKK